MSSSKEIWIRAHEEFIRLHKRRPSESEMQKFYAESMGDLIDHVLEDEALSKMAEEAKDEPEVEFSFEIQEEEE